MHSYHLAVLSGTPHRERLRQHLADVGIATGVHYPVPCHRQPALASQAKTVLQAAEQAAEEILSLPMYPHLSDEDVAGSSRRSGRYWRRSDLALAT